jgi:hypothetical protein
VDEETQADYLLRYYLLSLGTGLVERVYWWRLVARGYGLVAPEPDGGLRRRPSYEAMGTLIRMLDGWTFTGPLETREGAFLYRFVRGTSCRLVGWAVRPEMVADIPSRPTRVSSRDGRELPVSDGTTVTLGPSPCFVDI